MEPNNTLDIVRQGDLGGEKVAMRLDQNGLAHIMSILTDLYSDPEMAVVREYSTNAWDAHVEAGISKPIEVSTPTALSPFFRVKDYGVGLSVDDITNIYSLYGASTKRGTNEQTGMLGLGCKSALTYTHQFNINAVKNGVKAMVSVSRVEDGSGVMEIVDTCATTEPNGVEIIVPAKTGNDFEAKAEKFFKYWPKDRVLLNGQAPAGLTDAEEISEGLWTVPGDEKDFVVMGGVAYPVTSLWSGRTWNNMFGIVAYVDMGAVNFTPSREELQYTTLTNKTVAELKQRFQTALHQRILKDIADAKDHKDAFMRYTKWTSMIGKYAMPNQGKMYFQNEEIPDAFTGTHIQYKPNRARYQVRTENRLYSTEIEKAVMVTNVTVSSLTPRHKEKLKYWAGQNGGTPDKFILCSKPIGEPWLTAQRVVDWSVIATTKLPRNPTTGAAGGTPTFDTWTKAGYQSQTTLPAGKVYYYSRAEEIDEYNARVLTEFIPDATIVVVGMNRWDKMKRDYPHVQHISEAAKTVVENAAKSLTEIDRLKMHMSYRDSNIVTFLDPSRIDDPEVVKYLTMLKAAQTGNTVNVTKFRRAADFARTCNTSSVAIDAVEIENPLDGYPLLDEMNTYGRASDDVYLYMNAKFAQKGN